MDAIDFSALHSIIRRLPFPLVLFGNPPDVGFANDRFTEVFQSGQLDSAELRRLAHDPGGAWQSV